MTRFWNKITSHVTQRGLCGSPGSGDRLVAQDVSPGSAYTDRLSPGSGDRTVGGVPFTVEGMSPLRGLTAVVLVGPTTCVVGY